MDFRNREVEHEKDKVTLQTDMDLQRELDAMKQERVLQSEKAKLQVRFT